MKVFTFLWLLTISYASIMDRQHESCISSQCPSPGIGKVVNWLTISIENPTAAEIDELHEMMDEYRKLMSGRVYDELDTIVNWTNVARKFDRLHQITQRFSEIGDEPGVDGLKLYETALAWFPSRLSKKKSFCFILRVVNAREKGEE